MRQVKQLEQLFMEKINPIVHHSADFLNVLGEILLSVPFFWIKRLKRGRLQPKTRRDHKKSKQSWINWNIFFNAENIAVLLPKITSLPELQPNSQKRSLHRASSKSAWSSASFTSNKNHSRLEVAITKSSWNFKSSKITINIYIYIISLWWHVMTWKIPFLIFFRSFICRPSHFPCSAFWASLRYIGSEKKHGNLWRKGRRKTACAAQGCEKWRNPKDPDMS